MKKTVCDVCGKDIVEPKNFPCTMFNFNNGRSLTLWPRLTLVTTDDMVVDLCGEHFSEAIKRLAYEADPPDRKG